MSKSALSTSRRKKILRLLGAGFILMHLLAYVHAYTFTHYSDTTKPKSRIEDLSWLQKAGIIFTGISHPRPEGTRTPAFPYQTLHIRSGVDTLEVWESTGEFSKGTILLFHGYSGEKSELIDRATFFVESGYRVSLIDFRGSGGSTNRYTTIGYNEAEDVVAAVQQLTSESRQPVYLYGISMGAASILRAESLHSLPVQGLILECPFGTMHQTIKNRFENMGLPAFPWVDLLMFWGGIQHGFWAYAHNPIDYAAETETPTLLLHGALDPRVNLEEISSIYEALQGPKVLKIFPKAAHGNYLQVDQAGWKAEIDRFLNDAPTNISHSP